MNAYKKDIQHILIVENSRLTRRKLSRELCSEGYHVEIAGSGDTALDMINNSQPDLVIIRDNLSDMTCIRLCHKIKKQEISRHIPVFILTRRNRKQDYLMGYVAGVNRYILIPFTIDKLVEEIEAARTRFGRKYPTENRIPEPVIG